MSKETVELTFEKIDKYFSAVKQVLEQHTSDIVDLGLNALRIEALSNLFPWIIFFILFTVYYLVYFKNFLQWIINKCKDPEDESGYLWTFTVINLGIAFLFIISFAQISDLWNWVGIFYPELYAVHKFLL